MYIYIYIYIYIWHCLSCGSRIGLRSAGWSAVTGRGAGLSFSATHWRRHCQDPDQGFQDCDLRAGGFPSNSLQVQDLGLDTGLVLALADASFCPQTFSWWRDPKLWMASGSCFGSMSKLSFSLSLSFPSPSIRPHGAARDAQPVNAAAGCKLRLFRLA